MRAHGSARGTSERTDQHGRESLTCGNTIRRHGCTPVITGPGLLLICGFGYCSLAGRHSSRLHTTACVALLTRVWSRPSSLRSSTISPLVDLLAVRSQSARRPYSTVQWPWITHDGHSSSFQRYQGFLTAGARLAGPFCAPAFALRRRGRRFESCRGHRVISQDIGTL